MNKSTLSLYAAAVLALSPAALLPTLAHAQVGINIIIGDAPPPPRIETMPAARRGYVWAPGYWNWDGRRHDWVAGHWETERRGYQFRRAEWVRERDGWRLDRGGWINGPQPVHVGYATIAPPPPRHESIPRPRAGYVWAPGYWDWRGNRHQWVGGSWLRARPGYVYTQPHWVERGGQWHREESRWDRRNDRHDDRHDGPGKDHRNDHNNGRGDKDRDGVPNRHDDRPNDPRRH